jgi:hypothetical protein
MGVNLFIFLNFRVSAILKIAQKHIVQTIYTGFSPVENFMDISYFILFLFL